MTDSPAQPAPSRPTRASRHAAQPEGAEQAEALAAPLRPVEVGVVAVLGVFLAVAAQGGRTLSAVFIGVIGLLVAAGWHYVFDGPTPWVPTVALAEVAVLAPWVANATNPEPPLTYLPLVLAGGLLLVFLHQLSRRDGRAGLTESVAISAAGLAVISIGATYVALVRQPANRYVVTAAGVGLAVAALADLMVARPVLRRCGLPMAMALGMWGALGVSTVSHSVVSTTAVVLGVLVGDVGYVVRRMLSPLPGIVTLRGQLAAAGASVLLAGLVAYGVSRLTLF